MNKAAKIFLSYSKEDSYAKDELLKHLKPLERQGKIEIWHYDLMIPGQQWDATIKENLESANIIVLLISANFLASDYAYKVELSTALKRQKQENVRIIPIILSECLWQDTEISKFQVVPSNGQPIYGRRQSQNPDEAFFQVSQAINYAIDDLIDSKNIIKGGTIIAGGNVHIGDSNVIITNKGDVIVGDLPTYNVEEVFPLNGVPKITFVEPISFKKLVASIRHVGRGIVVEGPSGIGKTTAIKKATERLNLSEKECIYLSARNPSDLEKIDTINTWHQNIVIVDDFHRLTEATKENISNYLKYLADVETANKKLIIIGIPNTGTKLISFGHDLATRVDIFEFSKVKNEKINELIEKGEKALNIKFEKKSDLIISANGSLSIAQFLCYHSAIDDDIYETVPITKIVKGNIGDIIIEVKRIVSRKFDNFIFEFSQLGGNRDRTCIKLLKEIAISENGSINLERILHTKPELAVGVERIIEDCQIEKLWEKEQDCKTFLFYDKITTDLVVDDPQLLFYLNHTSEETIGNMAGKRTMRNRERVFISYSHKDTSYLDRVLTHLKPLFREGVIDVWSDKRIKPGEKWNKEIEKALESTKVAILLISADFIASDYIVNNELPQLISACSEEGASILPVFLKPANLNKFDKITQYQGINSPTSTIIDISESEQEKLFVKLSQRVEELYQ